MIPFDAAFAAVEEFSATEHGLWLLLSLFVDLLAVCALLQAFKAATAARTSRKTRQREHPAAHACAGMCEASALWGLRVLQLAADAWDRAGRAAHCRECVTDRRRPCLHTPRREPAPPAPAMAPRPAAAPRDLTHRPREAEWFCGRRLRAERSWGSGGVGRFGVLLGLVGLCTGGAEGSLVGAIDSQADREVFVLRCTDLVRYHMDFEVPTLRGVNEQRALTSAEEFAAQRRYKEALVHYLHARSLAPVPQLHFLVGLTCMQLKMYQHAEVALRKALTALEPSEAHTPTILYATTMLMLGHLDYQRPHPGDGTLIAGLKQVATYPLKPHQKSFLLSGLAALIAADPSRAKLAEEPAQEAHRLDESNTIALHVLGLTYMKRYIYSRAREWLRKAAMQDDHPMHQKLLVRCVWVQYDGYEGMRDKDKSIQAHLELANTYKYSPVASMGLVMAYANSKKYYSALKESNRTLELFLTSTNHHLLWDPSEPLVVELLSLRLVCLMLHSHYATAFREMLAHTDMSHPVTAASVAVLVVCSVIILVLAVIFGWEGCIIGAFGLVLLVLRGVLTMILLSAVNSTYQSMMNEPFPIASVLSVV
eukprot:TRINITY_DN14914_c0_g1_i1.p1 TRINITY_DN14914_c0_g1~~TRINITY_DN14914_c0_g1_i1.p1  ORF type:complete len:594 (+),score=185.82 TRINITY_DN14914_c0_g1_i1:71-1852(+)